MLVGQKKLEETFKRLVKSDKLSHGYIFFGEPQVGKYSFALSLAAFLEKGELEEVETVNGFPKHMLEELLIIKPTDGAIGIDAVRELKHFLAQKPVKSKSRVAILDDAHMLTSQAENAILKIGEEPPAQSLIILIVPSVDSLMRTLQSRFQKIYFQRSSAEEISKMLEDKYGIESKRAKDIAKLSLGRPGRAVAFLNDEKAKERFRTVVALLSGKVSKHDVLESVTENDVELYLLLTEIIAKLANDPIKNYDILWSITERITAMSQFTVNKRLQAETAIWTI